MVIPIGLDLASDCSFPDCTEAAANGLLLLSGHVQSLLFIGIMQAFSSTVVYCKGFDGVGKIEKSNVVLDKHNSLGTTAKRLCETYTDYSGKTEINRQK